MRSNKRIIICYKSPKMGFIPGYLQLAQRHLEKERPIVPTGCAVVSYSVPVDLLRLAVGNDLADDVEEIRLCYRDRVR